MVIVTPLGKYHQLGVIMEVGEAQRLQPLGLGASPLECLLP